MKRKVLQLRLGFVLKINFVANVVCFPLFSSLFLVTHT